MVGALPSPLLSVNDVVLTTVKPLQKTDHPETIDPNLVDLFVTDLFIPVMFAYRLLSNSEETYLKFLSRIKESLQKALIPFFPFAGRWIPTLEGRGRQLLCNDEGVPFMEASVDKDLDSVVRASPKFQTVPELHGYEVLGIASNMLQAEMLPDGLPSLFVQVTRFKCGGLVLGVTFNHMSCDAKAFFDFMLAWSDISRTNKTNIKPNHNRALAKTFDDILPPRSEDLKMLSVGRDSDKVETVSSPENLTDSGKWAIKVLEVGASTINALKSEVRDNNDGQYVSTVDCISAQLWKHVSKLPSTVRDGKEAQIVYPVEGRNRFYDLPLPDIFGNVLTSLGFPKIPKPELSQMPLSSIACEIRHKLLSVSRGAWFTIERLMETAEASSYPKVVSWGLTSWRSFPMYNADFGIGKPFWVFGPNCNSVLFGSLGQVTILPPAPGNPSSAATVCVRSASKVFMALESDPDFLSFFEQHEEL